MIDLLPPASTTQTRRWLRRLAGQRTAAITLQPSTNLTITKNIDITDSGVVDPFTGIPVGALYNNSGINIFAGNMTLSGLYATGATIGVDPDPDPLPPHLTPQTFDDFSQLTVTSQIAAGFLHKTRLGELVLNPLSINPFTLAVTPGVTQ